MTHCSDPLGFMRLKKSFISPATEASFILFTIVVVVKLLEPFLNFSFIILGSFWWPGLPFEVDQGMLAYSWVSKHKHAVLFCFYRAQNFFLASYQFHDPLKNQVKTHWWVKTHCLGNHCSGLLHCFSTFSPYSTVWSDQDINLMPDLAASCIQDKYHTTVHYSLCSHNGPLTSAWSTLIGVGGVFPSFTAI